MIVGFQIRDWLTVEEEMLRQQAVVVGDVDEIIQLIDKQKVSFSKSIRSTFFYFPVIFTVDVMPAKSIEFFERKASFKARAAVPRFPSRHRYYLARYYWNHVLVTFIYIYMKEKRMKRGKETRKQPVKVRKQN